MDKCSGWSYQKNIAVEKRPKDQKTIISQTTIPNSNIQRFTTQYSTLSLLAFSTFLYNPRSCLKFQISTCLLAVRGGHSQFHGIRQYPPATTSE